MAGRQRSDKTVIQSTYIASALLPQGSWSFNLVAQGSTGRGRMVQGLFSNVRNPTFCLLIRLLRVAHIEQKIMMLHLSMTQVAKNFWLT